MLQQHCGVPWLYSFGMWTSQRIGRRAGTAVLVLGSRFTRTGRGLRRVHKMAARLPLPPGASVHVRLPVGCVMEADGISGHARLHLTTQLRPMVETMQAFGLTDVRINLGKNQDASAWVQTMRFDAGGCIYLKGLDVLFYGNADPALST